jgi:epothilone polyketide synthase D
MADKLHDISEPIAITGIGCRFPGASGPADFWRLLQHGRDAVGEAPKDRFDADAYFHPSAATPGKTASRWGGFLEDIDAFDAAFFGISPREAIPMDPQQRLLLEVTWEALEDAGEVPSNLRGSRTGVFIGQTASDYWDLQSGRTDLGRQAIYALVGSLNHAAASGRLSFAFDLRGPSVTLDTACSSSMTAVHLACQSLRSGEAHLALVGAANIILSPETSLIFSQAGMLSPEGRSKFADDRADGFVRSEGVAVVVLKPLSTALAAGDQVYAVILGTAVNSDGQGSGQLVTPAVSGQREVLRLAYENAGVDPILVDYLEAHGTGTPVGDPVELTAAAAVLGAGRSAQEPCVVGSVKTNIGHTETTAGIAGLIKAALSLKYRQVPATLHHHEPTTAIDWEAAKLVVSRELTPLADRGRPLVAGVSSFGITGTNAHAVLREVGDRPAQPAEADDRSYLLVLSARTSGALTDLAHSYTAYLSPAGDGAANALRDICHSAATRRMHLEHRLAVVGASHDELRQRLTGYLRDYVYGDPLAAVIANEVVVAAPRIAFVFPGQGSQWVGMGRELLASCPAFTQAMRECDAAIAQESGWSVIEVLGGQKAARFGELDVLQPTLWAIETALAQTWRSWGIEPDVVLGHSMGEVAAAHIAGSLSLSDAAAVICRRSGIARKLSGQGAMASVELPADEVSELLGDYDGRITLAAINGPASVVVSGEPVAIKELLAAVEHRGVFGRRIDVDFASHSPQVDSIHQELSQSLADLRPGVGAIPIHSTVEGAPIDGAVMDGGYWGRNLREPVLFSSVIQQIAREQETIFLEVSPHPILTTAMTESLRALDSASVAIGSLRRSKPERATLLATLGVLHTRGHEIDWESVNGASTSYVRLPTYPWQREQYWIERTKRPVPEQCAPDQPVRSVAPRHPLLGARVVTDLVTGRYIWEGVLDRKVNAYLDDHQIQGHVVLPGPAYIEMIAAAMRDTTGEVGPITICDIDYRNALFLPAGRRPWLRLTLTRELAENWHFDVSSRDEGAEPWTIHVTGSVRMVPDEGTRGGNAEPIAVIRDRCTARETGEEFYERYKRSGNTWGKRGQGIRQIWQANNEALVRIRCPDELEPTLDGQGFHPVLLDTCGHSLAAALDDTAEGPFVLRAIDRVRMVRPATGDLWSHIRVIPTPQQDSVTGDVEILDEAGSLIAEMSGMRMQFLNVERATDQPPRDALGVDVRSWLYEPQWQRIERSLRQLPPGGAWLLMADTRGMAEALRNQLEEVGQTCVTVTPGWTYARTGPHRYQINPESDQDMVRVLSDGLNQTGAAAWLGIVHLWNLDVGTENIPTAILLGCRSVVRLVQSLPAGLDSLRLWLITRGAQAVAAADPVNPARAPIWGLGRAISAEQPELRCTLADLDPSRDGSDDARSLYEELLAADDEDQIALRGGERFGARLVRSRYADALSSSLNPADHVHPGPVHPGPGQVKIEVAYAAIVNWPPPETTEPLESATNGPRTTGWECAGRVLKLGPQVNGLAIGDEVIALGVSAIAPQVIAHAHQILRKPARLSLKEAATLPTTFLNSCMTLSRLARTAMGDQAEANLRDVLDHIEPGTLSESPHRTFTADQLSEAVPWLVEANRPSKILLTYPGRHADEPSIRRAPRKTMRSDVTYLITGGLGGLGMTLARKFIEWGARHLLLVGRSPLPPADIEPTPAQADRIRALRELEDAGARVCYEALDISDERALREMLARYQQEGSPAIYGVVHAAGVLHHTPVQELQDTDLDDMLGPKTSGAWTLHEALKDTELEFFILFSSASSLLSSPLLGGYAPGNAFLDALAHHRRRLGLPATSINWGFWSSVGMIARLERELGTPLLPQGMFRLTPDQGIEIFNALREAAAVQTLVMPIDWPRWRAAYPAAASSPLLRELSQDTTSFDARSKTAEHTSVLTPTPATATAEPKPKDVPLADTENEQNNLVGGHPNVEAHLSEVITKVLGLKEGSLNPHLPLRKQGLDSLMAAEVRQQLQRALQVDLPIMKLLGESPLAEIAAEIKTLMPGGAAESGNSAALSGAR